MVTYIEVCHAHLNKLNKYQAKMLCKCVHVTVPSLLFILKSQDISPWSFRGRPDPMTMGICPIYKIQDNSPRSKIFGRTNPKVRGSEMDFTLKDHGQMSVFNFRGTVICPLQVADTRRATVFTCFID